MNTQPKVIITFNPDGTVESEAIGFQGTACDKALKAVEHALESKPTNVKRKPEYFQKEVKTVRN